MPTTRSRAALLDTNASGPELAADAPLPPTYKPRARKRTRREMENEDQQETDAVLSAKPSKKRKIKKKAASAAPPPPEAMVVPKIIIKRVNKVPAQKALQSLLVGRQRPQAWDLPLEGKPGHAGFSLPTLPSTGGATAHGDSAPVQADAQADTPPTQAEPPRGEETTTPLPASGMVPTANLDAEADAVSEESEDATKDSVAQVQEGDPDGPNFENEPASHMDLAATTRDIAGDEDAPVAGEEEYIEVPVLENGADKVSGGDEDDESEDQPENQEEPLENCEISEVFEEGAFEDNCGQPPVLGITGSSLDGEDANDDAFSTHTADAEGEAEEPFEEIVEVGDQAEAHGEIPEVTEEAEDVEARDDSDDAKIPGAEHGTDLSDTSVYTGANELIADPGEIHTAPETTEEDNVGTYFCFDDGFFEKEFGRENWGVPAYAPSPASTPNSDSIRNVGDVPADGIPVSIPLDYSGQGEGMDGGDQDVEDDFGQAENRILDEEAEDVETQEDLADAQPSTSETQPFGLDAFQGQGDSTFDLNAFHQYNNASSLQGDGAFVAFEDFNLAEVGEISQQLLQGFLNGSHVVPHASSLLLNNGFVQEPLENERLENTSLGDDQIPADIHLGDGPEQVDPHFQETSELNGARLAPGMIDRTASTMSFASSSTLAAGIVPGPTGSAGLSPLVAGMNAVGPSTPTSRTEGIREALCEIAVHVKAISEKLGEIATMM